MIQNWYIKAISPLRTGEIVFQMWFVRCITQHCDIKYPNKQRSPLNSKYKSTAVWARTRSGFSYPTMISAAADRSNGCDEWRLPASWSSCRRRWCWTLTCCSWWPRWSDWHKPGRSCLCLQSVHGLTTNAASWFVAVTGHFGALLRAFSPYRGPYKLFILIKC